MPKDKKFCLLGPGIEPGSQQCECRVLTAILSKLRCYYVYSNQRNNRKVKNVDLGQNLEEIRKIETLNDTMI